MSAPDPITVPDERAREEFAVLLAAGDRDGMVDYLLGLLAAERIALAAELLTSSRKREPDA